MKPTLGLLTFLVLAPFAQAADIEAGKAKVQAVCSACHGAAGVSVSDTIPNLAGQKSAYIEAQLKALKDGSRKNPVMGAIASQLNPTTWPTSRPSLPPSREQRHRPNPTSCPTW